MASFFRGCGPMALYHLKGITEDDVIAAIGTIVDPALTESDRDASFTSAVAYTDLWPAKADFTLLATERPTRRRRLCSRFSILFSIFWMVVFILTSTDAD